MIHFDEKKFFNEKEKDFDAENEESFDFKLHPMNTKKKENVLNAKP